MRAWSAAYAGSGNASRAGMPSTSRPALRSLKVALTHSQTWPGPRWSEIERFIAFPDPSLGGTIRCIVPVVVDNPELQCR